MAKSPDGRGGIMLIEQFGNVLCSELAFESHTELRILNNRGVGNVLEDDGNLRDKVFSYLAKCGLETFRKQFPDTRLVGFAIEGPQRPLLGGFRTKSGTRFSSSRRCVSPSSASSLLLTAWL